MILIFLLVKMGDLNYENRLFDTCFSRFLRDFATGFTTSRFIKGWMEHTFLDGKIINLPSGKHTKSYWKWPFIVDFPMKNGDFP
jgi:hypothetical protein